MTKILFVCHGNICRSPMAEMVLKKILKENGLEVLEEICDLSARFVVNRVSMKMERERILDLVDKIKAQLAD